MNRRCRLKSDSQQPNAIPELDLDYFVRIIKGFGIFT